MLTAKVPTRPFNSTDSIIRVLETPSIAFFMYFISVACWKYFEAAILSTIRNSFFPAFLLDALVDGRIDLTKGRENVNTK